jgi:glycosyltransferase involved in cell wall biosynthesis
VTHAASRPLRLLVAVDTYVPARLSAALQMRDLVAELRRQGHDPVVLTPDASLAATVVEDQIDGSPVLRVSAMPSKDVGKVRRAVAEAGLPYSLWRGLRASRFASTRFDGVVWYSPTIFLGPFVRAEMRRNGCPSYLILRDLFPDWAVDAGLMRRGAAYRFFKAVERYQYRVASRIGVQTPANAPLVRRDAPDSARIEVLNNWLQRPGVGSMRVDLARTSLAGRTVFAYAGNMGLAQGMDVLLDLARDLLGRRDIGFLFVGRGTESVRLRQRAEEEQLDNVLFLEEIDANEVPALLAQCHVGLIALDPRHTTHNIPGKLITYLHAGLPVLASINPGNDLESLIVEQAVGFVVAGIDPLRLRAYAEELADFPGLREDMGRRGSALALESFSPAAVATQIVQGLLADSARS